MMPEFKIVHLAMQHASDAVELDQQHALLATETHIERYLQGPVSAKLDIMQHQLL